MVEGDRSGNVSKGDDDSGRNSGNGCDSDSARHKANGNGSRGSGGASADGSESECRKGTLVRVVTAVVVVLNRGSANGSGS